MSAPAMARWAPWFAVGLVVGCNAPISTSAPASATTPESTPAAMPQATRAAEAATTTDPGFVALDSSVIAASDTLDTLRKRLGAANVVNAKVPGAEGEEFDGWRVFADDPTRSLYIYLDDAGTHPTLVRVLDRESHWQRADGIRMGRTLTELAQRNGAPVGFTGFDWDYGGSCCDWHDGKLARDPAMGGMTLCPPETAATADADYPMGDAQFDSNHPWVVAHPPTVCEFGLAFDLAAPAAPETP
ncbi:MAG: hypothetical protein ACREO3_11570 [Arenimonas sp.]